MFFISAPDIYSFSPLCAAQIFLTKFMLWIKARYCVNMTQISVWWPDIFNGFYVTTMRMSE